ncbi:hypothetical protein Ahy_B10g102173 [Arachis hypogaea]|uniref:Uncharacterized protein n=1 Tax=Arachis hypogaea TaxID=3818 RepID=A0A444X1C7_ARAHY|nr:hypothetical protein Ahy_B10g102173 [Arachis hypogaea]
MKSSSEESDVEFPEVNLAELKKGPPYVCSLFKKITSFDKANDMKDKSGKKYNFDISKSDQTFDVLLRDKQLALLKGKTDLIQEAIMEGRLKFDNAKKDMKVDIDPFDTGANFAKPIFLGINMVGFTYKFDTALGDFETNVRSVYPGVVKG